MPRTMIVRAGKSLVEVMNIEPAPRTFFIQAWDRDGATTLQKTFNLVARETKRIDLCKERSGITRPLKNHKKGCF